MSESHRHTGCITAGRITALGFGVGAVGAWMALLHHGSGAPAPKPNRPSLEVTLRPLAASFPDAGVADEVPCAGDTRRVPLVAFSAIAGAPQPLEQELFPDAFPPTASVETEDGRVAVLQSIADEERQGRYEGRIVVFDGVTRQALCKTPVQVSALGDLRWADVSPRGLHRAHLESIRRQVLVGAARLRIELRI
jgi:hypothetical protein